MGGGQETTGPPQQQQHPSFWLLSLSTPPPSPFFTPPDPSRSVEIITVRLQLRGLPLLSLSLSLSCSPKRSLENLKPLQCIWLMCALVTFLSPVSTPFLDKTVPVFNCDDRSCFLLPSPLRMAPTEVTRSSVCVCVWTCTVHWGGVCFNYMQLFGGFEGGLRGAYKCK